MSDIPIAPKPVPGAVHPLSAHEIGLDWRMTRQYMRQDFARFLANVGEGHSASKRLFWRLLPSNQALFWYRVSRFLYIKGWRTTAMFVFLFNLYLTRAELPPTTSIGPGCLIGHAVGVILLGRIGSGFTVYGQAGTGGGIGDGDVGGGSGLPWVGDNVVFGMKAMALGPIRIEDGARLGPAAVVTRDVAAGATVFGVPPRMQRVASMEG
jgi:serine O-acetyltransferase